MTSACSMALYGALCGNLHCGNHKISHGAALKLRSTFEHGMQIGADTGFEAGSRNGLWHGQLLLNLFLWQFAVHNHLTEPGTQGVGPMGSSLNTIRLSPM